MSYKRQSSFTEADVKNPKQLATKLFQEFTRLERALQDSGTNTVKVIQTLTQSIQTVQQIAQNDYRANSNPVAAAGSVIPFSSTLGTVSYRVIQISCVETVSGLATSCSISAKTPIGFTATPDSGNDVILEWMCVKDK